MKSSKETFDLESNTRFDCDPWLLDDHPLRSYPTECIPGLSLYLDEYYESIGKRRAILFRAACLILGCLAAFQYTRPGALKSSLNEGCDGLRTAVWMHHGELQIGNAVTETEPEDFLQRLGLDPLLAKLDAGNDATARTSLNPETPGSFHADLAQTFLLMLDAKTPLHELYPHLVEQLDTLRQRGVSVSLGWTECCSAPCDCRGYWGGIL
ncbi:hypothetical protein HAV15_009937 [Penicillium sp. str. |nr:hypothetical protein HAV15_009937 [Penicillium sp. str. \